MPVYFNQQGDLGVATWHRSADADGVPCCSVSLNSYHANPRVRELFAELTAAVADFHRRTSAIEGATPAERLDAFPYCSECKSPEAEEIRHLLGQGASVEQIATTPSGLPLSCCRVRTLGAYGRSDTPQPTARR
jgi:hypothetical protein